MKCFELSFKKNGIRNMLNMFQQNCRRLRGLQKNHLMRFTISFRKKSNRMQINLTLLYHL